MIYGISIHGVQRIVKRTVKCLRDNGDTYLRTEMVIYDRENTGFTVYMYHEDGLSVVDETKGSVR